MANQFTYGYLKEAVKAHLDLEEDELEVLNINQRFHIFANEAIQQICYSKPKHLYFQFIAVSTFTAVDDLEDDDLAEHWNDLGVYLVGQVISMPNDFLSFAVKKAFLWTDSILNKQAASKLHLTYLSTNELVVFYAATYQIPYQSTWFTFKQDLEEDALLPMPSDLLLTIPIYVASVCLQQRNLNMAQAKRQEFELAVSRCKSINLLENKSVTPTFR